MHQMSQEIFGDRLLVVDDEPAFGQIVKRVAQGCGYEVVVTETADAFISAARLWHPTVIMLDLKIPGSDGVELLRSLAADKCSAHILLSSGADAKVLESAMQLGRERGLRMSETLQKPIRAESLRERLTGFRRVPKLQLSADLSRAIATDQLFLEYQPKFDCRLSRVTGVEALVRWRHPLHGIIPPDQFIGLAEENGLIERLTDWVVSTAAQQAARWRTERGLMLNVAVNVSARDVEHLDFPDRLERRCLAAGLDPEFMTIELTETCAMREAMQMMDVLTRLRLKGFKLSIDDFATGYSSLVQLQKMPFSELKIDKSFVMQMTANRGCRVIVEILVDLARKLGLSSVAEGVEDQAALDSLVEIGCDMVQGYYVSRPVGADRIPDFAAESTPLERQPATILPAASKEAAA
jgi:EAL domain-containing protein (putative c-di-GMP-specific phosphodiesterase class I)/ActR/RegA family two-component response regulator